MGKERKFEGRKFQVTTQELVEEGVEMLMSHQPNADGKNVCLLYTSPSPRDQRGARMPSSA